MSRSAHEDPSPPREFLCLATTIDLASRHPTGWAIADHLRTGLLIDALTACGYTFETVPQLLVPAGPSQARSTAWAPGPADLPSAVAADLPSAVAADLPSAVAAVLSAPLMGRSVPP
ncbi:hypothetical protein [Streptomyces microflavus]|uniref:hypothetical protein n=1 Tax=Streptomyces microflavus TaxID=1919 RepID=UPI003403492D